MMTTSPDSVGSVGGAHTPGPWAIEVTANTTWVGPLKADGGKVGNIVVAVEGGRGLGYTADYIAKQNANAALIAAAPEMLLVLWEMFCEGPVEIAMAGNPMAIQHLQARAHAVIAKATATPSAPEGS